MTDAYWLAVAASMESAVEHDPSISLPVVNLVLDFAALIRSHLGGYLDWPAMLVIAGLLEAASECYGATP